MMSQTHPSTEAGITTEMYKQASEDHRFYGDMRFKQLSLFGIVSALLINALNSQAHLSAAAVSLIGMASTAVLWIMEVRSSIHGQVARQIKRSLEHPSTKPGTEFPPRWVLVNATTAIAAFYLAVFVAWCTVFVVHSRHPVRYGAPLVAFLLFLVAFTIREYGPLFRHALKNWRW